MAGEFPTQWQVPRIKNSFQEIDSRSETGSEELLCISHYTHITLERERQLGCLDKCERKTSARDCKGVAGGIEVGLWLMGIILIVA